MEGKIDHQGFLCINRGSKLERMECPFKTRLNDFNSPKCNNNCPHFGEPEPQGDGSFIEINLTCGSGVYLGFDYFTDERA